MPAPQQQDWPDRRGEILGSTVTLCILSALVLIWRIVYGVLQKRKMLLCDYLLIIAAILNICTTAIRFKATDYALGRHIMDPSVDKVTGVRHYSYWIYVNQVINLVAMSILKYSVCAYLFALKFSKIYTGIVWASVVMVTVFNLILPMISNLNCTPFEKNWNKGPGVEGKCWYVAPLGITYMQGVSNCLTDVVYVIAPLLYLRVIQLPQRTQWGLRVVFCLGLIVTACSIVKTIELSALLKTRDPTWDGVNLTIWSATELSVGILIASLPPLRKQFDSLFRLILPSTFMSKSKTPNSIPLYNTSKHQFSKPMGRSEINDDISEAGSSERNFLAEDQTGSMGITKTVVHEITRTEQEDKEKPPARIHEKYGKMSG